jgi:hypothetical protein
VDHIDLSEWYEPTEAAAVISKNSSKDVNSDYLRKLAQYGKIRKLKISSRASLYWKEDVNNYRAEEPGIKAGRAKKQAKLN